MFRPIKHLVLGVVLTLFAVSAQAQYGAKNGEWPYYAADPGGTKYSPLTQIDKSNVNNLEVAWVWESADLEIPAAKRRQAGYFKTTPIMVDGVMYLSTPMNQIAAIDPGNGNTLWVFDPKTYDLGRPTNSGFQNRGVAYWSDGKGDERIFIATGNRQLVAVNAKTGETYENFGQGGMVDLGKELDRDDAQVRHLGFNAPPVIVGDTIILGSTVMDRPTSPAMPPGHIRGYDAKTGERKWIFHTIPMEGEVGNDTWKEGSWKYTGNTNAWTMFSVDTELGYIYIPTGTPTNDYYGGHRKGDNLFAETLICLNAETGERVWHFQAVRHGLWDYDFPAAPNLCDIVVDGKKIKAVAQISKQGFTYVFDRATGEPVWPIEDRAVPQSTVPGEVTAATQPFPTKPPSFARQGITENDLIDFTPELRAEALEIVKNYTMGPLFTPPTVLGANGKNGVIQIPSAAGGANWGGAAFDPETGMLYLQAADMHSLAHVSKGNKDRGVQTDYLIMGQMFVPGPQGLPLLKPPYGSVIAIDLNKGDIAWKVAHGDGPRDHPLLKDMNLPPLGASSHTFLSAGGPLLTKTLLFINQPQIDWKTISYSKTERYLRAFDKDTGAVVWEEKMTDAPYGTPMTYMHEGKQYISVACGGQGEPARLITYALP